MIITYGTRETQIDITHTVYSTCMKSSIIYIPSGDNERAKLFTDPIYGILKSVFIDATEYKANTPIYIDTVSNTVYTENVPPHIAEVYPEAVLASLHMKLVIRHGSFRDEFSEQKMAVRFLRESDKVLEIGGNIGRNSLIIASLVQDSLVTLESDPEIARQLEENRDANGMRFAIEASALSLRPLIQKGWDTVVSDVVLDGYKKVPTLSLEELRKKYPIPFTALVLDCEGAFYYILHDMPDILDGIHTILMENDYYNVSHKEYIDATLRQKGFTCVYTEELGPEYAYKNFPFHSTFFEAWRLTPEA